MNNEYIKISLSLPANIGRALDRRAEIEKRSRSNMVLIALSEFLGGIEEDQAAEDMPCTFCGTIDPDHPRSIVRDKWLCAPCDAEGVEE